jgi:hypothetical protein
MSELKRDYWSDTLFCITGKVKMDRREIAAIVECHRENVGDREIYLDIHLKSGSIFTVIEWNEDTIANLYLTESPSEGVKTVPYAKREDLKMSLLNVTSIPCICGKNTYNDTVPKNWHKSVCGVCDGWF